MDQQTSATTPDAASAAPPKDSPANDAPPLAEASTATSASGAGSAGEQSGDQPQAASFGSRGRLRRRARFLRKARELAYRDLGGLVFSLHRFGQRNDALVLAKLETLGRIDAELRALETSLSERHAVTVLREAGITACPRCAAIHSGEDRFCPSCGLSMSRKSDLPIAGAPAAPTPPPPAPPSNSAPTPATQAFDAVPPRSADSAGPASPLATEGPAAPAREDDQPTEIIRPPAAGS